MTAPIDAALKMAGKTLADVQSVELLGKRLNKTVIERLREMDAERVVGTERGREIETQRKGEKGREGGVEGEINR